MSGGGGGKGPKGCFILSHPGFFQYKVHARLNFHSKGFFFLHSTTNPYFSVVWPLIPPILSPLPFLSSVLPKLGEGAAPCGSAGLGPLGPPSGAPLNHAQSWHNPSLSSSRPGLEAVWVILPCRVVLDSMSAAGWSSLMALTELSRHGASHSIMNVLDISGCGYCFLVKWWVNCHSHVRSLLLFSVWIVEWLTWVTRRRLRYYSPKLYKAPMCMWSFKQAEANPFSFLVKKSSEHASPKDM